VRALNTVYTPRAFPDPVCRYIPPEGEAPWVAKVVSAAGGFVRACKMMSPPSPQFPDADSRTLAERRQLPHTPIGCPPSPIRPGALSPQCSSAGFPRHLHTLGSALTGLLAGFANDEAKPMPSRLKDLYELHPPAEEDRRRVQFTQGTLLLSKNYANLRITTRQCFPSAIRNEQCAQQ